VRPAALADVPALESLMAPYVATGDLLPRSNYDLCRHIKEYLVAEAGDGETASLPKAFAPLYFRLLTRAFCESKS